MQLVKVVKKILIYFSLVSLIFALAPSLLYAETQLTENDQGEKIIRSLESLRDIDYQSWQVVVYQTKNSSTPIILRIVGYPGTLRLDHPTNLLVSSGRKHWELEDLTIKNSKLIGDSRDAAAEFDLSPLLLDLKNNRPLRLSILGNLSDLPVPPYLVGEWRELLEDEV